MEKYPTNLKKLIMTLYISDACCKKSGFGYSDAEYTDDGLFNECLEALQIETIALDFISETVEQDLAKMESSGWL